ncbi:hypothetical protein B3286c1_1733 [Brucella vulpis]|nr:outer membrane protein E [Brucella vulpis]CUW50537.1 hypothetical protein B3286c1_1733 [Brucella vulpis]
MQAESFLFYVFVKVNALAVWEDIHEDGTREIAGFVAALLGSTIMAHAGGFERGSQDFDILFENGNAVEAGGTFVAPQRKLKNIHGSAIGTAPPPYGTGGINPTTGRPYETEVDEANSYWVPKVSAKFDITSDLACAAQYRQPWGIETDVGTGTVRMFTAIEQKISSNDYGVNCSYRFTAGEKKLLPYPWWRKLSGTEGRTD